MTFTSPPDPEPGRHPQTPALPAGIRSGSVAEPVFDETASPAAAEWRRRTWTEWLLHSMLQMVLVFCCYTLSIGPMFWYWFEATHVDGPEWIALVYAPLALLCDLVPPFGWFVNRYIDLWIL